jgi:hypothetical protein
MIYNNAKIWITTAGNIEMNGNDRHLVTYEQLEAAKEEFMEQLNSHTHGGVLAGGANTAAPNTMTFNITASKARTLYTGG